MIERERLNTENDGLCYYVENTTDILWEEWFYCYDLGMQLGPVIKKSVVHVKYFTTNHYSTGIGFIGQF